MVSLKKYFFRLFQKHLPPLSVTEKIALDAGDIWWESELLNGRPNWQNLLDMPEKTLTKAEQAFLDNEVEALCKLIDDWTLVTQKHIDESIWKHIKKNKFWGITIPKEYDGLGFSALAHSAIISKIASHSLSVAVATMVPNSLGPAELLQYYGTKEQKEHYLPRLANGKEIPCFALTGPEIGSDASHMPDTGIVCQGELNGQKILGIKLNWDKRYITLAPISTVIGLAFKLYDPDHLIGEVNDIGITLCLVPSTHPGVEIGQYHQPANLAFPNGPTRGKDVFIPFDWIIGGKEMAGKGWHMIMESLSIGRGISLPSLSAGSSQLCYRTSGAYAHLRKQFKYPIGAFEGVMEAMAHIGGFTYMIEATRLFTASAVDSKVKPTVASAIAKYHLTELSRKVTNHAMDIHGGRGIQNGPRNYLITPYFGAPMSITVEGANIMTRNLIIYGQGVIRCHRYLRTEMEALYNKNEDEGCKTFFTLLYKHIRFGLRNSLVSFWYGLSGSHFIQTPKDYLPLKKYYQQLTRMSASLAYVSDITLLCLGGNLKRKEFLSARLGDVLSYLYLASAVIKYYAQNDYAEDEWIYVEWSLQYCLAQIQIAFDAFFDNFPIRFLSHVLRWKVFPWGRSYRAPTDDLSTHIAKHMQAPSTLRDRLTKYCYKTDDPNDPVGRMENALHLQMQVVEIEKKRAQQETLTKAEKELWEKFDHARIDVIKVDEFQKLI